MLMKITTIIIIIIIAIRKVTKILIKKNDYK